MIFCAERELQFERCDWLLGCGYRCSSDVINNRYLHDVQSAATDCVMCPSRQYSRGRLIYSFYSASA